MTDFISPLTELDAVNTLLTTIGEAPINTLEGGETLSPDAQIARDILRRASRTIQSEGWPWNTDIRMELVPDVNGEILIPFNAIRINIDEDDIGFTRSFTRKGTIVQRGRKLYDRYNNTFKIDQTLFADVVTLLDFEDLIDPARDLITYRAARLFQDSIQADNALHAFTNEEMAFARAQLEQASYAAGDFNMLRNDPTTVDIAFRFTRRRT